MSAAQLDLSFKGRNNETFEVSQAFPWVADQWPLPYGSFFESHVRATPDAVSVILSFSSLDGSLIVNWDAGTTQVVLTWIKPETAMRLLKGTYSFDVRLMRPDGMGTRIDVIGEGSIEIDLGDTRTW